MTLILVAYFISSCSTDKQFSDKKFKEQLIRTLKENPHIVFDTMKNNPTEFLESVQNSAQKAQTQMAQKRKEQEESDFNQAFKNPLIPHIDETTIFKGSHDAPITLIEYSDFECPFCAKGNETVEDLLKKYPGKIKFIYKHLPLNFHPQAMISAQYYESIALQSKEKAFKFHDEIFKNQSKLKNGEVFLKSIAKNLKVNMLQLQKDIDSEKVLKKIELDIAEAKKFGFAGTPGFLINGIPVKGAFPAEHFVNIISKLVENGSLKI